MKGIRFIFIAAFFLTLATSATDAMASQSSKANLYNSADRDKQTQIALADEVRHQLLMLPYYGVFDWLDGVVETDGTVVLRGQVVRPVTKTDAEKSVKKLEGVKAVNNQIEVLPLSTFDDETRLAIYRKLVREVGLERYFLQAISSIHIIVRDGHVTLKGVVVSPMDSQLAYVAASGVPNVFDVKNELVVEKN